MALVDLFKSPLPTSFSDLESRVLTDGVTITPFTGGTLYSGTLQPGVDDSLDLGFGELELPPANADLPFRFAQFDSPGGHWHLDLVLDRISLKLRGVHGATFIKENGTTPRRLVRKAKDTDVVITGEATVRFVRASDSDPVVVLFVDNVTAVDPLANTGAVVALRCTPPHFLIGSSQFGVTVRQLLFDGSDTYSPPYIVAQGQGVEWRGFAVSEATLYAPPNAIGQGGFSGGVRNLMLGSPRGVQGEFEIQWGRAPLDPTTFVFTQQGQAAVGATGAGAALTVPITAGQGTSVTMSVSFVASNPPEGGAVTDWAATWRWPDGSETTGDAASGSVRHGQVLRVVPEEHIEDRPVIRHPELSFRFLASGDVPQIDVIVGPPGGGTSVVNTVHVSGPKADIAALHFRARSTAPAAGTFTWKLGDGPDKVDVSVTYAVSEITASTWLVLRENVAGQNRVARLWLQVAEDKPLMFGGEDGVVVASDPAPIAALTPTAVDGTYDLTDFHALGQYNDIFDLAEIDASRPEKVAVPDGGLAQVVIAEGGVPGSPPVYDRHIQLLFDFDSGEATGWADDHRPVEAASGSQSESDIHRQVLTWAAKYPGATFLAVGRCDDIGTAAYNRTLALTRRDKVVHFLTTALEGASFAPVAAGNITSWGEQDGPAGAIPPDTMSDEEDDPQRLIFATDNGTGAPLTDRTGWPVGQDTSHACELERAKFRRVDIYAVNGMPTSAAEVVARDPGRAPNLRRMLVPGLTVEPVPAETTTPALDYRVKLLAGWDKPTGSGWHDLIPSKAEFEFAWSPDDHPLPSLGGEAVTLEELTVYGNWKHVDATGFTRTQLGIRSNGDPDGLIKSEQANLVTAMALGPVLLSGVDSNTDTIEKAGRIAALAAGAAFARVPLADGGGPLVAAGSNAVVKSVEATAEIGNIDDVGNDYKVSLTASYSTTLHINAGKLGLRTDAEHPVKFRYKDVGIVFDQSKPDIWDKIGLAYPPGALTIEDPGKWRIDGVLGELLRIVEAAMGTGSIWFETRFACALTIGVVEISEATIRVTFDGMSPVPAFSLRGLVARVDIPATVKGEGRLRIEDPGGVIKAGLDLDIVPIGLKASAAFAMANITTPEPYTFVNLFAKVQFPVGIPLGQSGAAIHGFLGQTVINGVRDVVDSTDVVTRELGWWAKVPEDKYKPEKDRHALGLGVVVGTLPDASFSFSATGMLVVAFPDPEVILGVEINFLSVPDRTAKEAKNAQSAAVTGLIVIDDEAVSVAALARYDIPKILSVSAPFAARFPYTGRGIYVRIGSDGQMGRAGNPVTLTLLPTTINLTAFSYLMIEQEGLPSLGGRPDFSFEGFSVGFGAGAGLEWKAGPIKLSASILLLAGLGTDPLLIKAGIFVKGELDLVVVSVSASGEIILTYQEETLWLDGEFCGEVDCWLFSIKGCVRFRIGHEPLVTIPDPPPPVSSVSLIDRGERVMGEARGGAGALQGLPIFNIQQVGETTQNLGADPKDNHTVWADTVPVLNFRHYTLDAIPDGRQFNPALQPSGERWFGSNRLKYAYRLDDVRLVRASDGAPVTGTRPLLSTWCLLPYRQPGSGGAIPPSGAEIRSLKLLDWTPWGWALPMIDGGASAPGDPAQTVGDLCTPLPRPVRSCLFALDARAFGTERIRLLRETPPAGPYASRFTLTGRPAMRAANGSLVEGTALTALVAGAGALPIPGDVVDLPATVSGPAGPLKRGYRLPAVRLAGGGTVTEMALPWMADFDRTVRRGRLHLLVCDGRTRQGRDEPADCYRFAGLTIGKSFAALEVPGFALSASNALGRFTVTDDLTADNGQLLPGADSQPEVRITSPGLDIRPTRPIRILELQFYRLEAVPTEVRWKDAAGGSHSLTEPGADKGRITVRLMAPADITAIAIRTKAKQLYLTEMCVIGSSETGTCFDFFGVSAQAIAAGQFVHGGVGFTVLDRALGFRLADRVDARAIPPEAGADQVAELGFPSKGVELRADAPWDVVSIGVFSGGEPVLAIAFDAGGNAIAEARDAAREPAELHLKAPGIVRVVVSGGSGEAAIWRICHQPAQGEGTCIGFGEKPQRRLRQIELETLLITPGNVGETLNLADAVAAGEGGNTVELQVPTGGLVMAPQTPLAAATLYVAMPSGGKVEAVALDADGDMIAADRAESSDTAFVRLTLSGEGIARVIVQASGKVFITRVCTRSAARFGERASTEGLPIVVTYVGDKVHRWKPTVAASAGGRCQVVTYDQPDSVPDAAGFAIAASPRKTITLLAVCGIDSKAAIAHEEDEAARDDLLNLITGFVLADPLSARREVLLDPGETYRIEVDWSWQAWTSNEDGTNSPPAIPPATQWRQGDRQDFRFRVAREELHPTDTQDGLNEYLFDPRDVGRYLSRTEPADGRDVVFTDDPLWVHFSAGHVDPLVARYGRELILEVRRTDPPPQPDAPAMDAAVWPSVLEMLYLKGPRSVQPVAEQRINDAILTAPCLPDGPAVGGASLGGRFDLAPNAMYDFNLLAVKSGVAAHLRDPVVVSATRFRTSRYADPAKMLRALGFATVSADPYTPQDILLDDAMVLPGGPLSVSDLDMGSALAAIGADLLPLPGDAARTIALWRRNATGDFGVVGFLLDAPEPMRRVTAMVQGDQAVDAVRCEPANMLLGGTTFAPVRATINWTRVLFATPTPVVPTNEGECQLRLKIGTGSMTGRKTINRRPSMLDTEGF